MAKPLHVVTGGAGFIGSHIAAALDERGEDVIVVDTLGSDEKWRNIAKRRLLDIVPPARMVERLDALGRDVASVIHMGAVSSTTERDVDLIVESNFRLSCRVWDWCAERHVPLVYASSAATYGSGAHGFEDRQDAEWLAALRPLNAYGWSKNLFDRWVCDRIGQGGPQPPRWAGLKFFNVYGPNEYHKGRQRSVAVQLVEQIRRGEPTTLFASHHPDYPDGGQLRDFVWVGDCVEVVAWLLAAPRPSGIYNVGSGRARSFADLARSVHAAMGKPADIRYVPMPAALVSTYQYFTEATTAKLAAAGYPLPATSLEEGVRRYVCDYLQAADAYR